MTTIHANTPRDALTRLEHMTAMSGFDIPTRALRGQIGSAIHIIVQLQRFSDGRRRVVSLQEITGLENEVIAMQEIYKFERRGVDANEQVIGRHVPTGIRPRFSQRAREFGYTMPESLFCDPEPFR
jgi:pilus assembly protein CpaF